MGIFISGDINIEETIAPSEKFVTGAQSPYLKAHGQNCHCRWKGTKNIREEQVSIAFRTAENGHEDKEALVLADMILDNRTAGLINLNLTQQQLVSQAYRSLMIMGLKISMVCQSQTNP